MKNETYEPHTSSISNTGANIMALIAYIAPVIVSWIPFIRYFAWLVPLALFFVEKKSRFVKFHAMQAFVLNAVCALLTFVLSVIVGGILSAALFNAYTAYAAWGVLSFISFVPVILSLILTVFAIIAMVKAYGYSEYHLPIAGGVAEKLTAKYGKVNP